MESVTSLKGVGENVAAKLSILGVTTVEELLHFYPRRYDDYSHITPIAKLSPGPVSVQATLKQIKGRYVRLAVTSF